MKKLLLALTLLISTSTYADTGCKLSISTSSDNVIATIDGESTKNVECGKNYSIQLMASKLSDKNSNDYFVVNLTNRETGITKTIIKGSASVTKKWEYRDFLIITTVESIGLYSFYLDDLI